MLLERGAERAAVRAARHRAAAGDGSFVLIGGPLGIGRSALLREIAADAEDFRVLRANAAAAEEDFAYGVARQLLEPVLARAGTSTRERWLSGPAQASRGVFTAGETGGPATLGALRALLAAIAEDRPTLLVIDDLQWADQPSLRWLAYLARRLEGLRVLVVASVRDGAPPDLTRIAATCLRPRPLSLAATRELVKDRLGASQADFVRLCHESTGGNPLFLAALLSDLAAEGSPGADLSHRRPALLRTRMLACLRTQPEPVRAFAKAFAVMAGEATEDTAEITGRLAGLDAPERAEAIRTLRDVGLLAADRLAFSHPAVLDAVEESTPAAERDELHRQAARLLYENGHPAEAVAARLLAAPGVRESWAPDVLRSAAAQARRRHAPERAARYLRRALLDSTAGGQDRARLLVDLAATEREFDPAAAGRHVAEAVPLLASAAERAVALTQISPMSLATTPPGEPELLEAVMHELDSDGSELALRLEARSRHARNVDATALADNVERFRAIAHDPPLGTAAGRELCAVLAHSAMLSGCLPATDVARVANGILAAEPAVPAHVHGGVPLAVISLVAADSVAVAGPWLDWALEQAESRGAKLAVALTEASHAFLLLGTGALGEAKDHALRAFELSLGWREATIRATIALCQVTSATREPELMRELLECDRVQPGDSLALDAARDLLRCSEAAARDPRAALDHALTCGRRLERAGWAGSPHFPWRTAAVTLHKWLGNIEAGKALAEEEYEQALVWGAPTMLSRALRLRGDLVPGDKGLALLEESVEVAEASVNRLEQARALIMLGTRLREAGAASAAERLRRGRELAQPCGADWLTWHDEVNQPTGLLTPTELKVASMAAQGRTNADIAADLGVSSRAIEKHLSKCYRKLDISGKAELRAVLKLSDPH